MLFRYCLLNFANRFPYAHDFLIENGNYPMGVAVNNLLQVGLQPFVIFFHFVNKIDFLV